MSAGACKEAWCRKKAQGMMNYACDSIDSFSVDDPKLSIKTSEIYIKYLKKAEKEATEEVNKSE